MRDSGKTTTLPPPVAAQAPVAPPATPRLPFEAIYRRYLGSLVGFFLNRGLLRPDAEDLAQETMTNAYRGYDSFRGDASDATWLFTIAGNVWRNHRRDGKAQRRDGENLSLDAAPEVAREMEDQARQRADGSSEDFLVRGLLDEERRREIWRAIPELAKQMRRALLLHLADLKYRETAEILDVEVGTVKSLVSQAKMRLREIVRRERPDLFDDGRGDGT